MTEAQSAIPLLVLLVGVLVVCNILLRCGCQRLGVPPLISYLLLGFGLRLLSDSWRFLTSETRPVLEFLAGIGVVALLFRVGLESKPVELLRQLRRATGIWAGNVFVSAACGYVAGRWLLGLTVVTSLIVATACTATSVGIAISVWRDANAVQTPQGELMLDVAEMDDLSSVLLMGFLFALLPALKGEAQAVGWIVANTAGVFLAKLLLFGGLCVALSLYAEGRITGFFSRIASRPGPMLVVTGISFMIAALAGLIGFSMAIGAFFAGLVFSRDPQAVKLDASFAALYDLFTPFFFIGVGLHINPQSLAGAWLPAAVLLAAAVLGKLAGAGVPAWLTLGTAGGVLVGVSMLPRAEIFMVVMQRGLRLGEWAVPAHVFSAMVLVSAVTCFVTPPALQPLLRRWHPKAQEDSR